MGVAELVDAEVDPGLGAVALPAVVGGVVGQRPAAAVDAGPEQRPARVPGPGQVQLDQGDVPAVIEQHGARGAALAVDARVFVVQPQVQVLDVQAADLAGPGAAHVGGLEQHLVPQPVQRQVLAGRREQITARTLATSAAAAGRGSLRGTLMVSILSIGFAGTRSWRTAQRQNEATAARLRLRVDGARPATSAR
jgi:hypothetical protein